MYRRTLGPTQLGASPSSCNGPENVCFSRGHFESGPAETHPLSDESGAYLNSENLP